MEKHLSAALGYLGLGMAQEAWDELEEIAAKDRARPHKQSPLARLIEGAEELIHATPV